jgi:hypothetical protein
VNVSAYLDPHYSRETHSTVSRHFLLWALIFSFAVNVATIAYLVMQWQDGVLWLAVEEMQPQDDGKSFSAQSETLKAHVARLFSKEDNELIEALSDSKMLANGYTMQEIALAILRTRGYQVEDPLRPLNSWPQPLTNFSFDALDGSHQTLPLFSSLSQADIQAVVEYFSTSALPYTAVGLIKRLAKSPDDAALKFALLRTDEWASFQRLIHLPEEELIALSEHLEAPSFMAIVDYGRTHTEDTNITPFLISLNTSNPSACLSDFIAASSADFLVQNADDATLCQILGLLPVSEHGVRLAMRLLNNQRKPLIWQAAQNYLATASGTPTLATMTRDQILACLHRIANPQKPTSHEPVQRPSEPVKAATPAAQLSTRVAARQLKPYRTYVIKKGDTLWSVAKRFQVDVEKLKYLNGLRGTALTVGKELRIPH